MKKIFLSQIWLLLSISVLIIGGFVFRKITEPQPLDIEQSSHQVSDFTQSLLPSRKPSGIYTFVETDDARAEIIARFLERYKSPLQPYDYFGQYLVEVADRYQLDYRLLPAIAMQESNLCKKIPPGSHNCLGFGIHSRGTLGFDSYEEGFDKAAKTLKEKYVDYGLTTPEKIMSKYTPHSNGSWAHSVNQWIHEMEYDSRVKGREASADANLLEYIN